MRAERDVEAGEELRHLYEANSSARLWSSYGFVPAGQVGASNPFETAGLEIPLITTTMRGDPEDLQLAKLETLRLAGVELGDTDIGEVMFFELPEEAEAGGSLLPAARQGCQKHQN